LHSVYPLFLLLLRLNIHIFPFFLTPPPPPTSTLFPYTTLFRSPDPYRPAPHTPGIRNMRPGQSSDGRCGSKYTPHCGPLTYQTPDRKSTRLNSSHVSISYAVFCLKKKNKVKIPLRSC